MELYLYSPICHHGRTGIILPSLCIMFNQYCSSGHKNWIRSRYNITCNSSIPLKFWVIIAFQHNPQAGWWNYPFSAQAEESCQSTNRGCGCTTVYEHPFAYPHYCEIQQPPKCCFSGPKADLLKGVILQHDSATPCRARCLQASLQ